MSKAFLQLVKAIFPLIAGLAFVIPVYSQQWVIVNKDNTRPETNDQSFGVARITTFAIARLGDYNNVQWSALSEEDTRRYIVEYSNDGVNYLSVGEVLADDGSYNLKHTIRNSRSLLYRLRIEMQDGRSYHSGAILVEGTDIPPVRIYPTAVEGNTVNVQADFPAESTRIVSSDGRLVYAKQLGGVTGFQSIVIPSLDKGMYWMTFYGNGWQTTSRFVIAK